MIPIDLIPIDHLQKSSWLTSLSLIRAIHPSVQSHRHRRAHQTSDLLLHNTNTQWVLSLEDVEVVASAVIAAAAAGSGVAAAATAAVVAEVASVVAVAAAAASEAVVVSEAVAVAVSEAVAVALAVGAEASRRGPAWPAPRPSKRP